MIRPSSLPILAQCAAFKGDEQRGEDDKNAGTLRHSALATALAGDRVALDSLADDEADAVEWALEYIKTHSPDGHAMRIEQKVSAMDDDFNIITAGTPDVTCGPELFDLKWRERNYDEQMAAYALAMMQNDGWPCVRIHILFAERKFARVITMTMEEATAIVAPIIKAAGEPDAKPMACDYCGWCAKRLTCPAMTVNVKPLVDARPEFTDDQRAAFAEWMAGGAHASKLTDAAFMSIALKIARQIADWCEAVEHHAKELAIKQGIVPTGFKLQSRQGNRFISSVTDAFARAGLPQDEFLKICEIKFTALTEKFAEVNGMKKAQAERTVEEKLGDTLQRKASTLSLVVDKQRDVASK